MLLAQRLHARNHRLDARLQRVLHAPVVFLDIHAHGLRGGKDVFLPGIAQFALVGGQWLIEGRLHRFNIALERILHGNNVLMQRFNLGKRPLHFRIGIHMVDAVHREQMRGNGALLLQKDDIQQFGQRGHVNHPAKEREVNGFLAGAKALAIVVGVPQRANHCARPIRAFPYEIIRATLGHAARADKMRNAKSRMNLRKLRMEAKLVGKIVYIFHAAAILAHFLPSPQKVANLGFRVAHKDIRLGVPRADQNPLRLDQGAHTAFVFRTDFKIVVDQQGMPIGNKILDCSFFHQGQQPVEHFYQSIAEFLKRKIPFPIPMAVWNHMHRIGFFHAFLLLFSDCFIP